MLSSLTPSERLVSALTSIHAGDRDVRAWEYLAVDEAMRCAGTLDHGRDLSAYPSLHGLVVGVKDVIDVAGMPTKAGSRSQANAAAALADAVVVSGLRRAGTIILGKTKTTEFAYTDPTDTANPANHDHTPGGSSSGSAAAVAAGTADLTLGTQTVGSVCRPAAYCGVGAFKPTTGTTPTIGVTPLARSFDTVGFFAKRISVAYDGFACATGIAPLGSPDTVSPLKIGVLSDPFYQTASGDVLAAMQKALNRFEKLGATISRIAMGVDFPAMRENHRTMMFTEAFARHGELLHAPSLLGQNWLAALERGRQISEEDYWHARDQLAQAKLRMALAIADVDVMLLPPAPSTAPKGLHSTGDAGFILPWTVLGSPLAVVPTGLAPAGLPTAVMIAGKPYGDLRTAEVANRLQIELNK